MDETQLLRVHWEQSLITNQNLIIQNKIQIKMAEFVIEKCKIEINKFPEDKVEVKKDKAPVGVQ